MPVSKRDRLIESAAELFHRHGIGSTSLADIAKDAEIPIGNVYYYFKTKEELALAALEKRRTMLDQAYHHLDETHADPRARLMEAVRFFERVKEEYARYGCPIGKIVLDGGGEKDTVARSAAQVFDHFVAWAQQQFIQLGHTQEAHKYAVSLMAGIQGAAVMAKASGNAQIMQDEIDRLAEWLENLPNKKIFLGKAGVRAS